MQRKIIQLLVLGVVLNILAAISALIEAFLWLGRALGITSQERGFWT